MKNIVFILLSFCLAGEMEVDGGLSVTEGVTAASFVGNGGGLTGIGIKPERIYTFYSYWQFTPLTVPNSKIWRILATSHQNSSTVAFMINEEIYNLGNSQDGSTHEI